MRIIAGKLKGRAFDAPKGHRTHPMSDKMRGALFNVLGDIEDLTVLDAFAGSGALGFEAVSRGARSVVLLDNDRAAQQAIAQNIRQLGLQDKVKLTSVSAGTWFTTNPSARFDLVLCDPPYDDQQLAVIARLAQLVERGGLLILSWPGGQDLPELTNLELIESRQYGDAQLGFYRASSVL